MRSSSGNLWYQRPWALRAFGALPLLGTMFVVGWGVPAGLFNDSLWLGTFAWMAAGVGTCVWWKRVCAPDPAQWKRMCGILIIWILLLINVVGFGQIYEWLGRDDVDPGYGVFRNGVFYSGMACLIFCLAVTLRLFTVLFEVLGHEGPPPNPNVESAHRRRLEFRSEAPDDKPPTVPHGPTLAANSHLRLGHRAPFVIGPSLARSKEIPSVQAV